MNKTNPGLTSNKLKLIAIISMFIDHLAACCIERIMVAENIYVNLTNPMAMEPLAWLYIIMRLIGRVAFPIFIFLLIQGMMYTRSRGKYIFRLFTFAIISEVPFDLAFMLTDAQVDSRRFIEFSYQNVFFTLAIGALAIAALEYIRKGKPSFGWFTGGLFLSDIMSLSVIFAGAALSFFLKTDYGYLGFLAIIVMWIFKEKPLQGATIMCSVLLLSDISEITAFLSLVPVTMYNKKRGRSCKYLFYVFYPAHLIFLWILCRCAGFVK